MRSERAFPRVALAATLAVLTSAALAASASALPQLGLQMERTEAPLHRGDERLVYEVTVSNEADVTPTVGGTVTCKGTPADGLPWNGSPTFEYQWLRNGEEIAGATSNPYTVQAADEGKSLQCRVTGTNDPDGAGGSAYDPIASTVVSLPPVAIEPVAGGPSGSTRPTINGSAAATPTGTATITEGSKLLTNVVTVEGTGDLENGSDQVKNVTTTLGAFESVAGQAISGIGIPAETSVTDVEETPLGSGNVTLTLSNVATATANGVALKAGAGPFNAGQRITGPGIPADTFISCATNQGSCPVASVIEMNKPATASSAGATITGHAEEVCVPPSGWSASTTITWSFQWLRNGEPIPGATNPTYTVTSEDVDPPSFLQCEAIAKDEAGNEAITISSVLHTLPPVPDSTPPYTYPTASQNPTTEFGNDTTGPVTVEVELPAGEGVYAFKAVGDGWKCIRGLPDPPPAVVTCSREDALPPADTYPSIEVVEALGIDPPDPLITKARAFGGGSAEPPPVSDEYSIPLPAIPFGFKAFATSALDELGGEFSQAGGHPVSAGATLELNTRMRAEKDVGTKEVPVGSVRQIETIVPPGFVGNPQALGGLCESLALVFSEECPAASLVGGFDGKVGTSFLTDVPVYAIEPEPGTPAQFAFSPLPELGYVLTPELRAEHGYAVSIVSAPIAKVLPLYSAGVDLCGFGAKSKLSSGGEVRFDGCRKASESGALDRPFLTLPTRCGDSASSTTEVRADSWEEPGVYASAKHTLTPPEGCENLAFEPEIEARPTTNRADSPSGLEFKLHIPQNEDPEGTATAHLKEAVVTLPEGLVVNPSSANGLGACSEAQLGMANGVANDEPVRCPDDSKIGAVSVTTPLLDHPLPGTLYVATPHQNPFNSLIALYLVVESPEDGITIKLAGKTEANPATGQLTTSFSQNPQAPVEDVALTLRSGAAAPLRTPPCGKHSVTSSLTPWSAPQSGPPASAKDSWQINRGPGGGACASSLPNTPSFEAGSASAIAGAFSPFNLELRREDGTQRFSQVTVTPPPGLLAKLAGTTRCPDASLAQAEAKSGREEQSSPSCPPGSELGTAAAAAGAGPAPYHATGKAYLAGPYKGAPLSIAIVTPAVAGPFDLGVVVVRAAAYVNPATAQVTVKSDPLPTILEGIPLDIRSANVSIDRPGFILNPTSCDEMAVSGELLSTLGQSASLSNRFQLAECGRLAFKPKLRLRLKGKTRRGAYQGLTATLTAKPGEANIARTAVTMPRSAFIAQEHLDTVCTRVQFAAEECPKGSIYGKATAKTPLLDEPLTGNVYLRSSSNELPDLVIALEGPDSLPIEVELAGRTDSNNGALRNTFDVVPDAPVSRFTLQLFGGSKGLIINSRNLCKGIQRAKVQMSAQNGKERSFRPVVRNGCGTKGKRRGGKGRR